MKHILVLITTLAVMIVVSKAEPRKVHLQLATISTNSLATAGAAAMVTNEVSTIGYFKGVYLDFGGYASPTCDVDIVATGSMGTIERTLLSKDDVAGDDEFYPREVADTTAGVTTTNTMVVIPLMANDKLVLKAYLANVTNTITLNAYIYVDDIP